MADLTPAARVEAWRKAKRKQGYKFVGLWMTPAGKGELDAVAWARQQDLGDCVLDLVRFYTETQGTADPRLEPRLQRRMEDNVEERLLKRLVAAGAAPSTALSAPSVEPPPLQAPPAAGMLRCHAGKGHPDYSEFSKTGTRREKCPKCDNEQHKAARAKNKKKATQGTSSRGSAARRNGSNTPRT
jgi:hypothetical protein